MVESNKILTVSYGTFSCTLEGFDDAFDMMKSIAEYFRDLAADDRYFGAEPPTPDPELIARIAARDGHRVEARAQQGGILVRPGLAAAPVVETPAAAPVAAAAVAAAAAPVAPPAAAEIVEVEDITDDILAQMDDIDGSLAADLAEVEEEAVETVAYADLDAAIGQALVDSDENLWDDGQVQPADEDEEGADDLSAVADFYLDEDEDDLIADNLMAEAAAPVAAAVPALDTSVAAKLQRIRAVVSRQPAEEEVEEIAYHEDEDYLEEEDALTAEAELDVADAEETYEEDDALAALAEEDAFAGTEEDVDAPVAAEADADDLAQAIAAQAIEEDRQRAEEAMAAPVAPAETDAPATGWARVMKIKRSDFEAGALRAAPAALQPIARSGTAPAVAAERFDGYDAGDSTLSAEDEADLRDALRDIHADVEGYAYDEDFEEEFDPEATAEEEGTALPAAAWDDAAWDAEEDDTPATRAEEDAALADLEAGDDFGIEEEDLPEAIALDAADADDLDEEDAYGELDAGDDLDEATALEADDADDLDEEEAYGELDAEDDLHEATALDAADADDLDEEDAYGEFDAGDDLHEATALEADDADIYEDEDEVILTAAREEDEEEAFEEAPVLVAPQPVTPARPAIARRARLHEAATDGDMDRILAETNQQLGESEGNRRRSAIAHLRAAVAATRAEKQAGSDLGAAPKSTDAYREDLAQVVRPRRARPTGQTPARRTDDRPAPLKLVAEQRIDTDAAHGKAPIRPRRVTIADLARQAAAEFEAPEDHAQDAAPAGSFAEYAETMGAAALPEVLEAAASYLSFVEGRDQFSRPQLMTKVRQLEIEDFSREDGLRSFGQLLREGKIRKIKGGRFTVSDRISFRPDQRAAG